ncbi:hypothetical protein AAFF_G00345920 [Aldrovandia affinis]|uniref:Uncharacterized protein n=1 Tax=Aldrovandia affinis TaxID=143900 RepID=A0AAD7WPM6_9TELE|nr:hypothetical protein AAFF_G00345920 [Aldrovandia affinis]
MVTPQHTASYSCYLCPLNSRAIDKNRTRLDSPSPPSGQCAVGQGCRCSQQGGCREFGGTGEGHSTSRNMDCYMTLQKCKAPPPASSKGESIYITMPSRTKTGGRSQQSGALKKALPNSK